MGTARIKPDTRMRSCLRPGQHDSRTKLGPHPRHYGHDPIFAVAPCQPVKFGPLRVHSTISYISRIPPTLTLIPHSFSFHPGLMGGGCAAYRRRAEVGASTTASMAATARRYAGRLLLHRGCQGHGLHRLHPAQAGLARPPLHTASCR